MSFNADIIAAQAVVFPGLNGFIGFDLSVPAPLRLLQIGLRYLARSDARLQARWENLTPPQQQTIQRVVSLMTDDNLLTRIVNEVLRLPNFATDEELLVFGHQLVLYAVPGVEDAMMDNHSALVQAWAEYRPPGVSDVIRAAQQELVNANQLALAQFTVITSSFETYLGFSQVSSLIHTCTECSIACRSTASHASPQSL